MKQKLSFYSESKVRDEIDQEDKFNNSQSKHRYSCKEEEKEENQEENK